jgi:TRAP-type C4-dicarboxylate transport system permease small subunit
MWFQRLFNGIRKVNKWVLVIFYAVIIAVCFAAVIFRYVFNDSLTWAEEFARYLFIALVFLGAAYVIPENGHLRMDVIYASLPRKARKVIDVVTATCAVVFLGYALKAVWAGIEMIGRQRWSSLPLPMRLAYLPMLIGIALSLIYVLDMMIRGRGPRRSVPEREDQGGGGAEAGEGIS